MIRKMFNRSRVLAPIAVTIPLFLMVVHFASAQRIGTQEVSATSAALWASHVPKVSFSMNAPVTGDLSFLPPLSYETGAEDVNSIALADLNGDGKLDLVVANCDPTGSGGCGFKRDGVIGVLLGNGDGSFQPAITYDSGGNLADSVAVADLNGDGIPDIVVTHLCTEKACEAKAGVSVLLGLGGGYFKTAVTYNSGSEQSYSVAVADVNGDGKPDLIIANACVGVPCDSGDGGVSVLLGNGNGTFQPPVTYDSGGLGAMSLVATDLDGDGVPDIVVTNCGCLDGDFFNSGSVAILLGNGDGTLQAAVTYPTGPYPWSVAVADLNGDGKADVAVANSCWCGHDASLAVLLGNGNGTLQPAVVYDSGFADTFSIAIADVNGDGKPDLLAGGVCGCLAVLTGNGDGTFQPAMMFAGGPGLTDSIATADLNGDGKTDVILGNQSRPGYVSVLLNDTGPCVGRCQTFTILTSGLNPSVYGQSVTFTATVTGLGSVPPTGTVVFSWLGNTIGTAKLNSSGTATITVSKLNADVFRMTATYRGDANNPNSTSPVMYQFVNQASSSATLSSSPNPSGVGQAITFSATVTSPTVKPGGPATFSAGETTLGTVELTNGQATLTTSSLTAGSTQVTVTFAGDSDIKGSTASVTQVVQ